MGMDIHLVTPQDNITKIMIVGGELRIPVAKLIPWQYFFADMLIYTATRFLIRASIILFYLRVFPPGPDRKLGRILMWTFYANFVYNLSFFLAVLFQCTPIHHFWDHWEGLGNGHCGNVNILVWVAAITGIVFDLWLLALPFPQLMALNLHWKKKVMGILMFGMGALVLIISLIRLKTINNFTRTSNPTSALPPLCTRDPQLTRARRGHCRRHRLVQHRDARRRHLPVPSQLPAAAPQAAAAHHQHDDGKLRDGRPDDDRDPRDDGWRQGRRGAGQGHQEGADDRVPHGPGRPGQQ
jgi:hypothetical protein